jgi:hypothetical protein
LLEKETNQLGQLFAARSSVAGSLWKILFSDFDETLQRPS